MIKRICSFCKKIMGFVVLEEWIPGLPFLCMGIQLAGYLVVNFSGFLGFLLRIQVIAVDKIDPFHSQNMKFALNGMFHKREDRAIYRKNCTTRFLHI